MAGNILQVNDQNFEAEIMQSEIPALVDFWAAWCGPCRAIAPVVEELSEEYSGKIKIAKLNVDECPATASKFGIRAIPTLIMFKGGKMVDQINGAVSKSHIAAALDKLV